MLTLHKVSFQFQLHLMPLIPKVDSLNVKNWMLNTESVALGLL